MTPPIQTNFAPDPTPSDMEHLRILNICCYVKAALELALACFYLMFVVIGGGFFGALAKASDNAAPSAFLFLFIPFLILFCTANDPGLAAGLNMKDGKITNAAVAAAMA